MVKSHLRIPECCPKSCNIKPSRYPSETFGAAGLGLIPVSEGLGPDPFLVLAKKSPCLECYDKESKAARNFTAQFI